MMNIAVLLAAGKGNRMNSEVPKQFLKLDGKMMIEYSLECFEKSKVVDGVVVVTGSDDVSLVKTITASYGKVLAVITGGAERYLSVVNALSYIKDNAECSTVMIHDSARPYIDEELLERLKEDTDRYGACIAAVPVKDTIKIADEDGFIASTPPRRTLYAAQTPQCFEFEMVYNAYNELVRKYGDNATVTDDAEVVEMMTGRRVKLTQGSYANNKITVPEDMQK